MVAGPGSGKTRVLTYRVAHLIQQGVAPWEILTLTFTNKAAREMKARIEKVVGERAHKVWAGTFHAVFSRILRVEADKIGYPSNFTIYDTEDSKSVLKAIIREMNLNKEHYNVNAIRSRISSAKSNLITPSLYEVNRDLMMQDKIARRPFLCKIYQKYVGRCKRAGAMDFDDLLFRLYELLQKNPDGVLKKYQQKFRYLLVDEFQDTNYLQYAIVKKMVSYAGSLRNVCVVGDDAQSIYSFRGATIKNILDFEKDFKPHGIQIFKLEQNYRSTNHIVEAANEVITQNRGQIPKTIWSHKGTGQHIKVIKALSENEEGKRVVDTILEQKNRWHLGNKDIAILYRTNAQSRVFEEYLRSYNISYRVFGGLSFYQRKEIKDLIAYLRLAVNQKDEEALRRVINFPRRGIGDATIEKISKLADVQNKTMWEVMTQVAVGARAKNALANFKAMIASLAQKATTDNAYELAIEAAKCSGLVGLLKKDTTITGMNRQENINSLLNGIKEFVENNFLSNDENQPDNSLAAYLQNIALLTDFDQKVENEDYVTLLSVHAAKGLEFSSVFVTGLEEKLFPSFMSMDTPEGLDEERRLFYVAITRAESFLTLTYAAGRYRYGRQQYNQPSRFLSEIQTNHLDSSSPRGSLSRAPLGRIEKLAMPVPSAGNGKGGSKVIGNFKRKPSSPNTSFKVDPETFRPSPTDLIQAGMKVLHLKFGEGKVLAIDGCRLSQGYQRV